MTDMSFSDPYAGYKSLMADMQKVGIDTVIVSGTGMLFKNKRRKLFRIGLGRR